MKFNTLIATLLVGTLSFGFSNDAFAKKGGDKGGEAAAEQQVETLPGGIVKTNVGFVDDIFLPVSDLFATFDGINESISGAKARILKAIGAEEGAAFADAFKAWVGANKESVKPSFADGKVDISFDEAGDEVKAAGEEIRGAIAAIVQSLAKLKDLGSKVQEVVAAAKEAPTKATAEVQNLLKNRDMAGMKALKKAIPHVKTNAQAAAKLPESVKGATKAAMDVLKDIKGAFGGGE